MNTSNPQDATLAPFKPAVSPFYDANVAKAFFSSCGKRETIVAGTTLFVENEKSNKKGIFTKPINAELFNKPIIHRMYLLTEGVVELTASGRIMLCTDWNTWAMENASGFGPTSGVWPRASSNTSYFLGLSVRYTFTY